MKIQNTIDDSYHLSRPNADITAWLFLEGKEIELKSFNIGFVQPIDKKMQPQGDVIGGCFTIVIGEIVENYLYEWGLYSWIKKSGEIIFKVEGASARTVIFFKNAYCIKLERKIDTRCDTLLTISAEEILINGVSFTNNWQ